MAKATRGGTSSRWREGVFSSLLAFLLNLITHFLSRCLCLPFVNLLSQLPLFRGARGKKKRKKREKNQFCNFFIKFFTGFFFQVSNLVLIFHYLFPQSPRPSLPAPANSACAIFLAAALGTTGEAPAGAGGAPSATVEQG